MKKLSIAFMAMLTLTVYGQEHKDERSHHKKEIRQTSKNLSPEQMAELSTKKMTLHLDLNEAQQKELYTIELEQAKLKKEGFEHRKEYQELSDTERYEMKTKRLESQIAFKEKMKNILTEEQYSKWEIGRTSREKGMRGKNKRGQARPQK